MGIIASRTPNLWIAGGALADLNVCLQVFERISAQSKNAKAGAVSSAVSHASGESTEFLDAAGVEETEAEGGGGDAKRWVPSSGIR